MGSVNKNNTYASTPRCVFPNIPCIRFIMYFLRMIRADGSWADLSASNTLCWYDPASCENQALTLAFWLKIYAAPGSGQYHGIISTLQSSGNIGSTISKGFDVYMDSSNMLFKVRIKSSDRVYSITSTLLPTSTWVHCTWVWRLDGNPYHMFYYENGGNVITSDASNSQSLSSATPDEPFFGRIFRNRDNYYGNVEIDDLIIISQALSASEVIELYMLHNQ